MKLKNISCIRIQSMSVAKTICWIPHTKKNKNIKKWWQNGKALYKWMNNPVYGKTMEHVRNRIDVKLVSNRKGYLKWKSKPSYMSHKIFGNDLVAIRKNKVTLTLNKPANIGMCMLEWSKGRHYNTNSIMFSYKINMVTTHGYYSQTLIV